MASEFIRQTRMEKVIKINGVDVKFRADASTPRMYRVMFSRDAFRDMSDLMECYSKSGRLPENGLETLENIAYCMAKQADPEVPEIMDWLAQFGMMDIYRHMMEIIELWGFNMKTSSTPKKKRGRRRAR